VLLLLIDCVDVAWKTSDTDLSVSWSDYQYNIYKDSLFSTT